ncbi:hypothetical protein HMPREF0293_2727, partial [Corynebacterium glucuronolyticum ATCC 51866]
MPLLLIYHYFIDPLNQSCSSEGYAGQSIRNEKQYLKESNVNPYFAAASRER